jgi:hypothetical protein
VNGKYQGQSLHFRATRRVSQGSKLIPTKESCELIGGGGAMSSLPHTVISYFCASFALARHGGGRSFGMMQLDAMTRSWRSPSHRGQLVYWKTAGSSHGTLARWIRTGPRPRLNLLTSFVSFELRSCLFWVLDCARPYR